jgi:hypothetical protein
VIGRLRSDGSGSQSNDWLCFRKSNDTTDTLLLFVKGSVNLTGLLLSHVDLHLELVSDVGGRKIIPKEEG